MMFLYSDGSMEIGGFGNRCNAVEQLQVIMALLSYFHVKGCFRTGCTHYCT